MNFSDEYFTVICPRCGSPSIKFPKKDLETTFFVTQRGQIRITTESGPVTAVCENCRTKFVKGSFDPTKETKTALNISVNISAGPGSVITGGNIKNSTIITGDYNEIDLGGEGTDADGNVWVTGSHNKIGGKKKVKSNKY